MSSRVTRTPCRRLAPSDGRRPSDVVVMVQLLPDAVDDVERVVHAEANTQGCHGSVLISYRFPSTPCS